MSARRYRRVLVVSCACAALSSLPAKTAGTSCLVATTSGPVQGVDAGASCTFLGIPYAAPPLGALRWKPPVPPTPWAHLNATTPAPSCPLIQPSGALAGNENCLKLNVWVRNPLPAGPAPVVVWLHTGGFVAASANMSSHNGRRLAEETGVIVVAPNYRLGPFGFLAHAALAAEDATHPVSGNYGLLDQRAVLAWVRDNIGQFGGDPANVTLAGTSAGADSTTLHMVAPGSSGLFHRAVIQSGSATMRWPSHDEALAQGTAFADALGCTDPGQVLDCMRLKSRDEVLQALSLGTPQVLEQAGRVLWTPVVDGLEIPDQPRRLFEAGRFEYVPTLLGTTRDEGAGFVTRSFPAGVSLSQYLDWLAVEFGPDAGAVEAQYPAASYPLPADAMARVVGDGQFSCEARRLARVFDDHRLPAYLYSYDYVIDDLSQGLVIHGLETNMLFGNDYTPPQFSNHVLSGADLELHAAMAGYWSRFAASGNPNDNGAVHWPAFTDPTGAGRGANKFLRLDAPIGDDKRPNETQCDFWESRFLRSMLGAVPAGGQPPGQERVLREVSRDRRARRAGR